MSGGEAVIPQLPALGFCLPLPPRRRRAAERAAVVLEVGQKARQKESGLHSEGRSGGYAKRFSTLCGSIGQDERVCKSVSL